MDFHLPGSASGTCLVAPQPVLKWARPTHFQWQVFAGPFWFAQTEIESDFLNDWASRIGGSTFQRIFMVKGMKESLDLAKLLLKWGSTADAFLSDREKAGQVLCSKCSQFQQELNEIYCLSYRLLPCPINWSPAFPQTPHSTCDCS